MASLSWLEAVKERARRALDKPAAYGPDVDVSAVSYTHLTLPTNREV